MLWPGSKQDDEVTQLLFLSDWLDLFAWFGDWVWFWLVLPFSCSS